MSIISRENGETAVKVGKAIYENPTVQKHWKKFKKEKRLEYLPFGKGKKIMKKRKQKVNKFKYRKGVVKV